MASTLLALPAELRLHIYEHLYCHTPTENVNLLHPSPPTKALTLTNKQLHHETHALYKSSYRAYWTLSAFTLDATAIPNPYAAREDLLALRQEDLNRIAALTIYGKPCEHCISRTFVLIDNRGGWRLSTVAAVPYNTFPPLEVEEMHEETTYRRYRVWLTRIGPGYPSVVDPTRLAWDGERDEESLKRACESCSTRGRNRIGVGDQICDLLGWELRKRVL